MNQPQQKISHFNHIFMSLFKSHNHITCIAKFFDSFFFYGLCTKCFNVTAWEVLSMCQIFLCWMYESNEFAIAKNVNKKKIEKESNRDRNAIDVAVNTSKPCSQACLSTFFVLLFLISWSLFIDFAYILRPINRTVIRQFAHLSRAVDSVIEIPMRSLFLCLFKLKNNLLFYWCLSLAFIFGDRIRKLSIQRIS